MERTPVPDIRSRIIEHIRVPASLLVPHPKNTRGENDPFQVSETTASLEGIGQVAELVTRRLPDGNYQLIDGHLRAGIAGDRLVDIGVTDLDDNETDKTIIALNRLAELRNTEPNLLAALLKDVEATTGLEGTGYDEKALAALLAEVSDNGKEPLEDPGPQEPPKEPVTRPGDVWLMRSAKGMEHRLVCGDCREVGSWEAILGDRKANVVFTSPPYAEQRKEQYGGVPASQYVEWFRDVANAVWAFLAEDGSFFVNLKAHCEDGERETYDKRLVLAMREWGWRFVDELVWDNMKAFPGVFGPRFKNQFEPVFHFATRPEVKFRPDAVSEEKDTRLVYEPHTGINPNTGNISAGGNLETGLVRPSNVIRVACGQGSVDHPAAFPVPLVERFVSGFADPGDLVADCFLGSGTLIIAAEQTGRVGAGIEAMPAYCDVAVLRWQRACGLRAILESTGEEFPLFEEVPSRA